MIKIIVLLSIILMTSCAMQINQYKESEKHGRWFYKNSDESFSRGRYIKGHQIGTWRDFQLGKLYRKERYSGNISKIKYYHPNHKVKAKGHAILERSLEELRWYYSGDWLYYNEKGKLIEVRTYYKGEEIAIKEY